MSHRFLYQNMIGAGTIVAPSSVAKAIVGGAVPRVANGAGAAVFSGAYTGQDQEVYTVEIGTAGQVGAAAFRWRKTSTPVGAWEASGLPTALTDTALDHGVQVRFANGASSPAFQTGDRWQATASQFRSPKKLYDLDPNTAWRSGSPPLDPETFVFDLGEARAPDALLIHGHNISASATVRIQANEADSWGSPALDEEVAWRGGTMAHYLSTAPRSYRYWRLLIGGEEGNPAGHVEIAELYLGGYFEPAYGFAWRSVVGEEAMERGQETENGSARSVLLNRGRRAVLPYAHVSAAQKGLFLSMFQAVKDKGAERNKPLFVHLDVNDADSLFLATLAGAFSPAEEGPDDYAFELELQERLT